MGNRSPKAVRRHLLQVLYDTYMDDPLVMLSPEDFLSGGQVERHDLAVNMHYLRDDGLVEVMLGYRPPLFISARITTKGIDLVENRYEFDRRFPRDMPQGEASLAAVPELIEQLVVEADLCSLDRPRRLTLFRDIQYLREELAQPSDAWRPEVIAKHLEWIAAPFADREGLPTLPRLRALLESLLSIPPKALDAP